jgi:hypothetical protein
MNFHVILSTKPRRSYCMLCILFRFLGQNCVFILYISEVCNMVERLYDTHHYARRHLRVASDRMKARYDRLANSARFQEGDRVWLYRPTRTRGRSPKLQSVWEGRTRSSPGLTTSSTRFSGTPGREWWWYIWTEWRRTWGLLGTSSLKERAVLHIRFSLVAWPMHHIAFP